MNKQFFGKIVWCQHVKLTGDVLAFGGYVDIAVGFWGCLPRQIFSFTKCQAQTKKTEKRSPEIVEQEKEQYYREAEVASIKFQVISIEPSEEMKIL